MNLLVTGSRLWTDKAAIRRLFVALAPALVIQGGNGYLSNGKLIYVESQLVNAVQGADALAWQAAKELYIEVETHFANWPLLGKAAGNVRNTIMLDRLMALAPERRVLALHEDLANSKGTRDMVRKALKANVRVDLYDGVNLTRL